MTNVRDTRNSAHSTESTVMRRRRPDTKDRGLDDTAESERPWTTIVRDNVETRSSEGLRVVVEYVVVDGEEAQALAQRQGAAIREVLEWLYAGHSAPETGHA